MSLFIWRFGVKLVFRCQNGKTGPEIPKLIQSRAQFGCGRQAVSIVDQRHLHDQHGGQHQDPRVQLFWIVGAWQLHGIFFVVPPPNGFRQA